MNIAESHTGVAGLINYIYAEIISDRQSLFTHCNVCSGPVKTRPAGIVHRPHLK